MEQIGQATKGLPALEGIDPSRRSQLRKLAKQAQWAEGLPTYLDRTVDIQIRNLICFRGDDGRVEIRRPLRGWEREAVQARAAALELALEPWQDDQRSQLEADVGAMLSGFRQMRQQGEDAESAVIVTLAMLRSFPAWAISAACARIAGGNAGLDRRYAPNDAQIVEIVTGIVTPYRRHLVAALGLLVAHAIPSELDPPPAPENLMTPEKWLARREEAKRAASGGTPETPEQATVRESAAARAVAEEYRAAGLAPPPGPMPTSLAMMLKAGWTIEEAGGRRRLVSPSKEGEKTDMDDEVTL